MNNKIYICLENGDIFEGKSFGSKGEILGELVFTTGMGGYIETLTDPSYFGQIVIQTFPLIGNYGFIDEDMESKGSAVSAYIIATVRQISAVIAALKGSLRTITLSVFMMLIQES